MSKGRFNKHIIVAFIVLLSLGVIGIGVYNSLYGQQDMVQGMADADTLKVSAKISARVAELYVYEGDVVQAGQPLFRLDSPEVEAKYQQALAAVNAAKAMVEKVEDGARVEQIQAAEANWQRAQAAANLSQKTAARLDRLYQEGVVSRQQRDEAWAQSTANAAMSKAAKAQYDEAITGARVQDKKAAYAQLQQALAALSEVEAARKEVLGLAPADGEVSKRLADIGELVPAAYPVFTLVDSNNLWVSFNVRENQFKHLHKGQVLLGDIPALAKRNVEFTVYYISPRAEFATWRATRQSVGYDVKSFEVRARAKDSIENFRPGMSVLFTWPQT